MDRRRRMEDNRKNETAVRVWTFRIAVLQDERHGGNARCWGYQDRTFCRMRSGLFRTLPQKTTDAKCHIHGQCFPTQLRRCMGRRTWHDDTGTRWQTKIHKLAGHAEIQNNQDKRTAGGSRKILETKNVRESYSRHKDQLRGSKLHTRNIHRKIRIERITVDTGTDRSSTTTHC